MKKRNATADIEITNSGSGFFGIHGMTRKGILWVNRRVHGANRGVAWSDDRRLAYEIVMGALDAGLKVKGEESLGAGII
jgi:hypothetical protein